MRRDEPIRTVVWGLDSVGMTVARLVGRRKGLVLVGAVDANPELEGLDLGDLMGFGERLKIAVHSDAGAVLTQARPDLVLIASSGRLEEVAPHVIKAMEFGGNVICLAPEMVYPWAADPKMAERLDDLAYAHGVTVLGTGIDPGFVLDSLALTLTGCCLDVERIRASRVIDLTPFGESVFREVGIGLSPSHFAERLENGRIRTHLGLEQSIHLIADALGWPLERVAEVREPILAEQRRTVGHLRVDPGQVAGVVAAAHGYVDGRVRIILEHSEQVAPDVEGIPTGDFIDVEGEPPIHLAIQPAVEGLRGSAALAVNMIGPVVMSGPGLKSMAEMPMPRAMLGDLRGMIDLRGLTVEEELARGWQGSSAQQANSLEIEDTQMH